jgi:hypothetical protein
MVSAPSPTLSDSLLAPIIAHPRFRAGSGMAGGQHGGCSLIQRQVVREASEPEPLCLECGGQQAMRTPWQPM